MTHPASRRPYDGPLAVHTGFWLRLVSNHVSGDFRKKLSERGVSVAEWALMSTLLDQGALPPSTIAVQLGITRGGITKIVDKLIERSLVSRSVDPADGRGQTLVLTSAGKRFVPVLATLADLNDREWFGHLPPEILASLTKVLRGIVEHHQLRKIPIA